MNYFFIRISSATPLSPLLIKCSSRITVSVSVTRTRARTKILKNKNEWRIAISMLSKAFRGESDLPES